jgi:hypothetical protein
VPAWLWWTLGTTPPGMGLVFYPAQGYRERRNQLMSHLAREVLGFFSVNSLGHAMHVTFSFSRNFSSNVWRFFFNHVVRSCLGKAAQILEETHI